MIDPRLLAHLVDAEDDAMRGAASLDDGLGRFLAVERKAHRQQRLQRIALSTASRRYIGLARAYPDCIIEHVDDGLRRDPRTVVGNGDRVLLGRDADRDLGRDVLLLANVDRVVSQLFQDDQRPVAHLMPDLGDQLPA